MVGRPAGPPTHRYELTASGLMRFIMDNVDIESALLMTDEYKGYNRMGQMMRHSTIHHAKRYADGLIHTNTIEGFWGLVKQAWFGTHHHYSRKYAGMYIREACFKYNNRKNTDAFRAFITCAVR